MKFVKTMLCRMLCRKHRGAALILSMIFILIFSALAVSIASLADTNVQIADNQHKTNCSRACAESGIEITRFWLNRVSVLGTTAPGLIFGQIANSLQSDLTVNGISNIVPDYDGSTSIITIPNVTLDSTNEQNFYASMAPKPTVSDPNTLQVDVTGVYSSVAKTISVNYKFGTRAHTVFDYGVATKGPLSLAGNIELDGVNVSVESDVYIVSENELLALSIIGNSQIAGDVHIANPLATVDLQGGQAGIGGETGQDAIDNHVSFGVPPTEFPVPDPGYFEHYVTNIFDTETDTTADLMLENIRIPAGTNPTFSGNVTLTGIVFIETPNIVTFSGNTNITGIIVGDGDYEDNSAVNQIIFQGNVDSSPVSELPDESQFAGIREETGTFLMAPGFKASFGGNFETLNGAIAASGISFFGNAGGAINGSVINYSETPMTLSGNSDLSFNRLEAGSVPAGFVPEIILEYDPTSYSEIVL